MEDFTWHGYPAEWRCSGDGTRVMWVRDTSDGTCEPMGEDTCDCSTCKKNAASAEKARAA